MNKPYLVVKVLRGAREIGKFIGENPDRIKHLVENEGLPAWRRHKKGTWRTTDLELSQWLLKQSLKYRND